MPRYIVAAITALMLSAVFGQAAAETGPIRKAIQGIFGRQAPAPAPAAQSQTGLEAVTMTYQGIERSYYVHVPAALVGRSGNPAVVVFHGGQGSGTNAASASNMAAAGDQIGFVAIFPNSLNSQWNDGRATTRSNVDDVGFVRAMIADAGARYGVAAGRVYAAGVSNGGLFTQRLACEAADAFSGFGVIVAGLPSDLQAGCAPSRAVPMIFFNGTTDRMMPFGGGEIKSSKLLGLGAGGKVLSRDATKAFWTEADGCTQSSGTKALPDSTADGTTVQSEEFSGCRSGVALRFYTITGGGHNWPGSATENSRLAGNVSHDISATQEIVQFFQRFGL